MTKDQLNNAMAILCPEISFSYQLTNGTLEWIRLEQPGICPTIEQIIAQIG